MDDSREVTARSTPEPTPDSSPRLTRDLMRGAARLRFQGDLEARFQDDYYQNSVILSRAALVVSLAMWLAFGLLDLYAVPSNTDAIWWIRFGIVGPFYGAITIFSFFPVARRVLQFCTGAGLFIVGSGMIAMAMIARPSELGFVFYPLGLLLEAMVGYSFLRLRFWFATVPNLMLLAIYAICALGLQHITRIPNGREIFIHNGFFLVTANFAGIGTCYSLEFYARRAFVSNYLLDLEREGEQRKRQQTESMLQILSQAIGGVVHDLGTPLTAIQTGAQILEDSIEQGDTDVTDLKTLTGIIINGSEMLNYQRLSLMEQTRVLQGQPIPLQRQSTSMLDLVQSALRFHATNASEQNRISWHGEEVELWIDPMKITTVLMNLISNALKYSDGKVRVSWQSCDNWTLISVADEGKKGRGLSREQAEKLFVAFGRLDEHSKIQGTGLGLLSVRKIVETHGGEVFIEGGGEEEEAAFSTAEGHFPRCLEAPFRSAFVMALPCGV